MRKILTLISLTFLLTCLISSAGIQVMKPKGGETILREADYTIQWNTLGKATNKVKIRLFDKTGTIKVAELTNSAPNTGQFVWKQKSLLTFPTDSYVLRIKTTDNKLSGDSAPFQIHDKKLPQIDDTKEPKIGLVELKALKPPSNAHRHRAPAIVQPSDASFFIEKIYYDIKQGKLRNVKVVVRYKSKTAFSFNKYQGDPKDGPVFMNCKISNPKWKSSAIQSEYPIEKSLDQPDVIFNHRLSIKYLGKNHLLCDPPILNPGIGHFQLIFNPDHSGKIIGLYVIKDKSVGPFSAGDNCKYLYSPKLEVRLFVHTKEGIKSSYKKLYLLRAEKSYLKVKGKVDDCNGGEKNW